MSEGPALQERHQQHFVDAPQSADPDASAKLMHHAHVGDPMPAGQIRKLAPRPLLRQHLQQEVDRVRGRQQNQKVSSPELRRAEVALTSACSGVRPVCREEWVGNERRKLLQECVGSGHR